MTHTPVIADADTGYGGLLNVAHTVKGYEKAGVSAIQIEDQQFPKKSVLNNSSNPVFMRVSKHFMVSINAIF